MYEHPLSACGILYSLPLLGRNKEHYCTFPGNSTRSELPDPQQPLPRAEMEGREGTGSRAGCSSAALRAFLVWICLLPKKPLSLQSCHKLELLELSFPLRDYSQSVDPFSCWAWMQCGRARGGAHLQLQPHSHAFYAMTENSHQKKRNFKHHLSTPDYFFCYTKPHFITISG